MGVQLTDFENAAFAVSVVLLSRAILHFNLNLYMPITKVDENMAKARARDGVLCEKLLFRRDILPVDQGPFSPTGVPFAHNSMYTKADPDGCEPMDMSSTMNGVSESEGFPALIPLVRAYIEKEV